MNTIAKEMASPILRAAIPGTEDAITISPVSGINLLQREARHRLENDGQKHKMQ